MVNRALPRFAQVCLLLTISSYLLGCQGMQQSSTTSNPPSTLTPSDLQGVLMWKGDSSASGLFGAETTLTPSNVNVNQFGKVATFQADGMVMAHQRSRHGHVWTPRCGHHRDRA